MPPAVRLSDKANCPADKHGCPACPHPTIGPAVNGSPDVFINKLPAIRLGDPGIHMACCGPNQWKVAKGSNTIYVNGKPLARMGDKTTHCGGDGKLINGSSNVFADDGGSGAGTLAALLAKAIAAGEALLAEWTANDQDKSGSWTEKAAKGKAGKGKSGSGKGGKGGGKGGKDGGKGGKGGKKNTNKDEGGGGGGGGDDADGPAEDISKDENGGDSDVSGVGLIAVKAAKTEIRPGMKLAFTVECRSATTGSIPVALVVEDGEGNPQVLKKTSVEAKLQAQGSVAVPKIPDWAEFAKKYKLSPDTTTVDVTLTADHPTGSVSSDPVKVSDDAVTDGIILWLNDETAEDGDSSAEPTGKRPVTLVEEKIPAKVKIKGSTKLYDVVFEGGKAELSGVDLPDLPDGVEPGDPDPRVEKVTLLDDKWKKHKSRAFVKTVGKKHPKDDEDDAGSPNSAGPDDGGDTGGDDSGEDEGAGEEAEETPEKPPVDVKIMKRAVVEDEGIEALKDLARAAGVKSLVVNSGKRTPEDQARAMYANCKKDLAAQKKLYGKAGLKVIAVFEANASAPAAKVQQLMVDKIKQVGPGSISNHMNDKRHVLDVDRGALGANLKKFLAAAKKDANCVHVIDEPQNGCVHLEFKKGGTDPGETTDGSDH